MAKQVKAKVIYSGINKPLIVRISNSKGIKNLTMTIDELQEMIVALSEGLERWTETQLGGC